MKKLSLFLVTLMFGLVLTACDKDDTSKDDPIDDGPVEFCKSRNYSYNQSDLHYDLVWSDEFDYEGEPDSTKWTVVNRGGGFGNNEDQWYTPDNATVTDGVLTITAKHEEGYEPNHDYTSAKLTTLGKAKWEYGKIEVRAKVPEGRGTWPAIWMLPSRSPYGGWPHSGEIDIMEHVGYDMNTIHGTVHTSIYNHQSGFGKGGSKALDDVSNTFHTYSIEWLPDKIEFFIDGVSYYTYTPPSYIDCPNYKHWPFDQEFYLILNLAIGGDWGGAHGVDDSIFPQTLEIDYVRIYQSDEITNLEQTLEQDE